MVSINPWSFNNTDEINTNTNVNNKKAPNNTNIFAVFEENGNGLIDEADVKYLKEGLSCTQITNWFKTHTGKWTNELKQEINNLIQRFNANTSYAESMRGEWQEVTAQEPMKAPETNVVANAEKNIQDAIKNLKPGESLQYVENLEHNNTLGYAKKGRTVTVTRNEDGTITESRADILNGKAVRLITKYDENNQKVSEDFIDPRKVNWGVKSTRYYKDGKPTHISTQLSDLGINADLAPLVLGLKNNPNYQESTIRDKNGNVLYTIKDGEYYNSKGKVVDSYKVFTLIEKAIEKGEKLKLYQDCK